MYKTTIEFVQLSKRRNNKVATSSSEYVEASSEQALAFLLFPRYEYTYESLQQFISIGSTFFRTFPKNISNRIYNRNCRNAGNDSEILPISKPILDSSETEKRNHP